MEARLHRLSIPTGSVLEMALFVAALVALAVTILVGGRVNEPLLADAAARPAQPAILCRLFSANPEGNKLNAFVMC